MHYCRIDPNADLPEIERELRYWRTRQLLTVIPSTAREVGDDIDDLIGAWQVKRAEG